ncbi:MAG: YkgJ family cysteine cluster protein [Bacillota bacterium]
MINNYKDLFEAYESLVARADQAFEKLQGEYGDCVKCRVQCADCCTSIFGLFPIESVYLNHHFNQLDDVVKQEVLARGDLYEQNLLKLQNKMRELDPGQRDEALARERVACPLLNNEQKCAIYQHRPITCRVYGIPTVISGMVHSCGKAGFAKGRSYPAFNLDKIYRELYHLSGALLEASGHPGPAEQAGLLHSVIRAIKTPAEDLLKDINSD